jgi:hypothetical protein
VGFGFLAVGGWLGGSLVFTHGMRVLGVTGPPAVKEVSPPRSGS